MTSLTNDMSNLDDAMEEYMAYIVISLCRAFSYIDFLQFDYDGKQYRVAHGTFRNKISNLVRSGKVVLAYRSVIAFYSLKGYSFEKPMTRTHAGGKSNLSNDPFVRMVQNLPLDRNAVHDIRLRFEVKGIWEYLSNCHPELHVNHFSRDILLPTWNIEDLLVRVSVHRTDTLSVSVGCSLAPVAVDFDGVIRLSNALTRVEERINEHLKSSSCNNQRLRLQVPEHKGWVVSMWHFGADSLLEYSGDKFSVTWGVGEHALLRAYTKPMKDKKTRIRLERQEYPNSTLADAILEKLNADKPKGRGSVN